MYKEFQFEAGQIQFLNNRVIGHKRTSFEDWPNKDKKRHLCRRCGYEIMAGFFITVKITSQRMIVFLVQYFWRVDKWQSMR